MRQGKHTINCFCKKAICWVSLKHISHFLFSFNSVVNLHNWGLSFSAIFLKTSLFSSKLGLYKTWYPEKKYPKIKVAEESSLSILVKEFIGSRYLPPNKNSCILILNNSLIKLNIFILGGSKYNSSICSTLILVSSIKSKFSSDFFFSSNNLLISLAKSAKTFFKYIINNISKHPFFKLYAFNKYSNALTSSLFPNIILIALSIIKGLLYSIFLFL